MKTLDLLIRQLEIWIMLQVSPDIDTGPYLKYLPELNNNLGKQTINNFYW